MENEPEQTIGNFTEKPKYTLEDLEREKKWDSGFGPNNPRAVSRELHEHAMRLREIEDYLKQTGTIEYTKQEKIDAELDKLYPDARSKTVVEYNGGKYKIKYFPRDKSNSGKTVYEWGHTWVPLK